MPRNGSGVYSLPAAYDVNVGDTIQPEDTETAFEDIETDLNAARPVSTGGTGATTAADARDNLGTQPTTRAIDTTGSADAYALATPETLASLTNGDLVYFVASFTNTGAATLNVDTLGAKNVQKVVSGTPTALAAGDITSGGHYSATYDASVGSGTWMLHNPDSFGASGTGIANVVEDTTPQLGGNLDVNGNSLVSTSNADITLTPNGTGNVVLGSFTLDADQTVGAGQDNYVFTYDNATGLVSLEAAPSSGISNVVEDTTPQLGGNLDLNSNGITFPGAVTVTDITGADLTLVSGTAGTSGNLASWNADGDAVDSGVVAANVLTDIVSDTTPQLGGNLDLNTNGLTFPGAVTCTDITGADTTLVSGTAGTNGNLVQWDANGDAVDSSVAASSVLAKTEGTETTVSSGSSSGQTTVPSGASIIVISGQQINPGSNESLLIRLGTSGGYDSTNYDSISREVIAGASYANTSGFAVADSVSGPINFTATLHHIGNDRWNINLNVFVDQTADEMWVGQGRLDMTAECDRIQIVSSGTFTGSGTWNFVAW